MLKILVTMIVICSVPNGKTMKEAWRIEEVVTLEHCLFMNDIFATAGSYGSVTVRCHRG